MAQVSEKERREIESVRMTLGEHLMELRTRLIRALLALAAGIVVCLIFGKHIFAFLAQPVLAGLLRAGYPPQLIQTSPPESFMTYLKISVLSGLFLASPAVFYQLWKFVSAGLYRHERRLVRVYGPMSLALFVCGAVFFMLVVAPYAMHFFARFASRYPRPGDSPLYKLLVPQKTHLEPTEGRSNAPRPAVAVFKGDPPSPQAGQLWVNLSRRELRLAVPQSEGPPIIYTVGRLEKGQFVRPLIDLNEYVAFVVVLSLAFGVSFELPLVVMFLASLGVVSIAQLRRARKYVLLLTLIVAAALTPPDVISQIALAVPLLGLYELGILLARVAEHRALRRMRQT